MNCNGICIDNWIRIFGHNSKNRNGISYYNKTINDPCLQGMVIVANDVVGGLYAINISRFEENKDLIWYFAPDTLQWECIFMNYINFIDFAANGNVDEFYESMRWTNWKMDCEKLDFNKGYLIYPFLWSRECDINTADKKPVDYLELINLNFDFSKKL